MPNFYLKNSKVRTIIIMKVYINHLLLYFHLQMQNKKELKYDHLGSYHYIYNVEFLITV